MGFRSLPDDSFVFPFVAGRNDGKGCAVRVLVQFFHPALEKSRVHRRLIGPAARVQGVTFRDLYELYPDFDVDVLAEQAALEAHDVVVFQHPLYWYSTPALLKQWQDLVLEHGWAYGRRGTRLRGKLAFHAISAGGDAAAYDPAGPNRRPLTDYLLPLRQTVQLCGMVWLPPFMVQGAHRLTEAQIDARATEYAEALRAFVAGSVDVPRLRQLEAMGPLPAEEA